MPIQNNARVPMLVSLAGLAGVLAYSCSNEVDVPAAAAPEAIEAKAPGVEVPANGRVAPDVWASTTEDQRVTTESGLQYVELEVGSGEAPEKGWDVKVDYTGWLEDGTRFDSSLDREEPLPLTLGAGKVIKGWDEGLMGMKVGGRRQLHIPPELGYGERGAGGVIPPGAKLIFDVQITEASKPKMPADIPEDGWITAASGLQYHDLSVGEGPKAEAGVWVRVHYRGWLEDGTRFDSSYLRGQPLRFPLGDGGVIAAWDEGIQGMAVGGKRSLLATPDLAYGESGFPGLIPPGATLRFDVELMEIEAPQVPESDTPKP